MLRAAFINHHGGVPGGGERSLEAFLRRVPSDIVPFVVLFEDGAYAERLRSIGLPVFIVPASPDLLAYSRSAARGVAAADVAKLILRLRALLRRLCVDVAVTNSMKAHIAGALAAWSSGIPVVTWLKELPEGRALTIVRIVSRLCARYRIGCSQAVVENLRLPRSTVLVPAMELAGSTPVPSAAAARASLGLPTEKRIFSMVGRIAPLKGQDRFLKAAALLRAQGITDVHFAIIGSPTFPEDRAFAPQLVELAHALGLSEAVSFIPWLDDPRVAYVASDLLCNASRREGFGRTTIEAALLGVPVVCFDDGGAAEAVLPGVTGTVVPAGDVHALAAAMTAYAVAPETLQRAGAAARLYGRRHDADQLAVQFFDVIRQAGRTREVPPTRTERPAPFAPSRISVPADRV